ncbi:MAG: acyl-CoA dehydrogenase domain protein [Ilumatobacteraceae bacterium]|nr:acyl-CoA dehydrogenase domain protein [Ilumatobacteraceae bacterium]
MDFEYPAGVEAFRAVVREWLDTNLTEEFRALGTGGEFHADDWSTRVAWEQTMGRGGWVGLSWPTEFGGRAATPLQELVFAEEYARSGAPTRAGTFGEGLLGPTLVHFGTPTQKERFLPPILAGTEIWCQGFSEPGAGSDLAALSTRARLDGDEWVLDGQKVWTSQAHLSDWIFVLARTGSEPGAAKHRGISFFLVPLRQPGIEIRPLVDMAGGEHFCEVFLDGARTSVDLIVGQPGDGWRIAMATLGFERGTAFMGQLRRYAAEFQRVVDLARSRGSAADPVVRDRLARLKIGLELMRFGAYRTITALLREGRPGPEASIGKLQWSQWHQELTALSIDLMGAQGMVSGPVRDATLHEMQHAFIFSRAHTIYAGSSQVQRNIIGERVLGLPKEPG